MKTSSILLTASAVLSLAASVPAIAQSPAPVDPEVKALLSQVADAYRNIQSFSANMEMTQGVTKSSTKLVFKKPNMVNAIVVRGGETKHFVVDGTNYFVDTTKDATKYVKAPSGDFATSIGKLSSNGGTGIGLLPILLTNPRAEQLMIPGKPTSVKKLADINVAADTCDTVQAVMGEGDKQSAYTFAFAKSDHLLRKLVYGSTKEGAAPTIIETYSDVNMAPETSAETFKYTPAAGAVATDPPKPPAYFDERLKPGFTPFPLKGVDLGGKAISYNDYKGKVLLVDFWATWCGPCVAELPNVIEAYKKYHAQGFEILGISLDQATAKDKLTSFIKEHNMDWPQIYDGKYWQAENAVAYGVRAIPFTLLIGKDGKVAAVGARGPALAPAIEAALKK